MSKIQLNKEEVAEFIIRAVKIGKEDLATELIIESMDNAYQAGWNAMGEDISKGVK